MPDVDDRRRRSVDHWLIELSEPISVAMSTVELLADVEISINKANILIHPAMLHATIQNLTDLNALAQNKRVNA